MQRTAGGKRAPQTRVAGRAAAHRTPQPAITLERVQRLKTAAAAGKRASLRVLNAVVQFIALLYIGSMAVAAARNGGRQR